VIYNKTCLSWQDEKEFEMWSKGFIPFQEKLHRKIGSLLNGFEYEEDTTDKKLKLVIYKPMSDSADCIIFSGMMFGNYDVKTQSLNFNWLRCQVISGGNTTQVLPVSPQNTQSNPYAVSGWVYTDEEGLDDSLQEIADIVNTHFYLVQELVATLKISKTRNAGGSQSLPYEDRDMRSAEHYTSTDC
jgi:hypothetical protein